MITVPKLDTIKGKPMRLLDYKEQSILTSILLDDNFVEESGIKECGAFKVALLRCTQYMRAPVEYKALAFIASVASSPAEIVMLLHAVNSLEPTLVAGSKSYTLEQIVFNLLAEGIPMKETFNQVWDAQKVSAADEGVSATGNWLDVREAWA